MKKYILILFSIILVGCTSRDFDYQLRDYISSHCDFNTKDTCCVDLKDIFQIDYDTMYLFDGYALPESVPLIVEGEPTTLKGGYLYGTEMDMVVLSINHKIVHKKGWKHQFVFLTDGKLVEKKGFFDGDSITVSSYIYVTSVFKVTKSNRDGDKSTTYLLEPIQ